MGSKSKLSHEIRPQIKREALYKLTPIYHKTAIGTWFKSLKTRLCILRSIFILFRVLCCYIVDIHPVKKIKINERKKELNAGNNNPFISL